MDLKQLRYFSAVVEQGSISAAARALFMSQPPLSTQVRQLEKELGVRLFDREGHTLSLTPAGKLLYDRARDLLDTARSVESEMRSMGRDGGAVLRLGAVSSVCSSDLPGWLSAFWRERPEVKVELYEQNTYQLLEKLRARQLDLAVIRTPFSADGLECRLVRREKVLAVGEGRFFSAIPPDEQKLPLKALAEMPLIVYRRWMPPLSDRMRKEGLSPVFRCVCDDARTAASLARTGAGVGVLPGSAAALAMGADMRQMEIESGSFGSSIVAALGRDGGHPAGSWEAAKAFLRALPAPDGDGPA